MRAPRAARSAATRTCSVCAGRPFFIRIGVSQASEAPAASRRGEHAGPQPRVQVVDVASRGPAASGSVTAASDRPTHRAPAAARWRARRIPRPPAPTPRPRPTSAAGRPSRDAAWRSSAAPVGVQSSTSTGPPYVGCAGAAAADDGGHGHGSSPCAPRTVPPPSATGETCSRVEAEVRRTRRTRRRRRRSRRARRPRGSGRRPARRRARRPRRRPAARTTPRARSSRTGSAGRRRRAAPRTSGQVPVRGRLRRPRRARGWRRAVPRRPARPSGRPAPAPPRRPRPGRSPRPATPASDQRAEQHVAADAPRRQVEPHRAECTHASAVASRCAGDPGREHAGAEAVVDVDDGDARARRS